MNCLALETILCDYIDGTLSAAGRAEVEQHLSECAACAEFAADVAGAVEFAGRAAAVEPPPELLTRILHEMPGAARHSLRKRPSWWRALFSAWLDPVLQPRYAMGMAMTILSFSMLARFAGIQVRQLKPSDLDPVKVWSLVDGRAHRAWDQVVRYYDNLRLVIEIQSRLSEWKDQEQEERKAPAASDAQPVKKK